MNYKAIYDTIVSNSRKRFIHTSNSKRSWSSLYHKLHPTEPIEIHHIVPVCLGGLDNSDNYCAVTPKEHFILHKLLWKLYPTNKLLLYAYNMMATDKNIPRLLTAKEFSIIRIECIFHNTGGKNHMYGKQHTSDTKIKLWKANILNGKCKPFLFKGNIYLSTHSASRLLSEHRSCITRHIKYHPSEYNRFITPTEFFDAYDIDSLIWQLNPTQDQITKYSIEYKSKCEQVALDEKVNQPIRHRNRAMELITNYINGSIDNLTTYSESIGYSTTYVNNYFRMFPLYNSICIPNKPFTRCMAQSLLDDGLPANAVLPYVGKPRKLYSKKNP